MATLTTEAQRAIDLLQERRTGFGSAGVLELVEDDQDGTYRAV